MNQTYDHIRSILIYIIIQFSLEWHKIIRWSALASHGSTGSPFTIRFLRILVLAEIGSTGWSPGDPCWFVSLIRSFGTSFHREIPRFTGFCGVFHDEFRVLPCTTYRCSFSRLCCIQEWILVIWPSYPLFASWTCDHPGNLVGRKAPKA